MTNSLLHYTHSSTASLTEPLLRQWGRSGDGNGRRKGRRITKLSVAETTGNHWLLPAAKMLWCHDCIVLIERKTHLVSSHFCHLLCHIELSPFNIQLHCFSHMLALSPHKIALVILWTIVFHTPFTKTCTSTCNYDYPYHCHHHSYNYLFASVSGKIRLSLWLPLQDPDESLEEKKGCQAALKFWILFLTPIPLDHIDQSWLNHSCPWEN